MNLIDLLLAIIIAFSVWMGWEKGFIHTFFDLCVWAGSLLAGFLLYAQVSFLLAKIVTTFAWILPVSFMLVVAVIGLLLSFLMRQLARQIPREILRSKTNRILGLIPGFVNGCISAVVITLLLLSVPLGGAVFKSTKSSMIANSFIPAGEWLQEHISPVFYEVGKHSLARLSVESGSERTMKLPFTKTDAAVREDLEMQMLQLVNTERQKNGLTPLVADTAMTKLARAYSRQMLERGFFSHYTPEKQDPFDRMRNAKIRFIIAGENLALARTLLTAHNGLMNSPGHRANILNPAYGRLGIGILDAGVYGLMISQEFRN